MTTTGYLPTRDEMRAIAEAARALLKIVRRWQKYAHLPGYPVERGNQSALNALFGLERALNPKRLPWDHKGRGSLPVRNWGNNAADGVAWLRDLLDLLMVKNNLESMAAAPDFDSWAAGSQPLPQTVSVCEDELLALRTAIRCLPDLDTPSQSESPVIAARLRHRRCDSPSEPEEVTPVVLFGPGVRPLVLGRPKVKLTLAQFRVVKALLDAGEAGLCKARLQTISGDAINVLKRLAKSDDDWGAVIHLPGLPGRGYRIGAPTGLEQSTPSHTTPPLRSHTSPHSSESL
jgi:hypothetical protein